MTDKKQSSADSAYLDTDREARYGKYCRTRTLREDKMLDDTYMEAHQLADGKWIVNRVTAVEIEDKNNPGQKQTARDVRRIAMNLGFLHAIAQLSAFEHGQPNPNVEFVGETAEELGNAHFIAFAEREGLVFDANKTPHDTLDGQVVDAGRFLDADLERASLRAKQAANEFPGLADGSKSQYGRADREDTDDGLVVPDASLGDVFARNAGVVDLGETLDNMEEIGILDHFMEHFSKFESALSTSLRQPFKRHENDYLFFETYTNYFNRSMDFLKQAEKALSDYNTPEHRDEYNELKGFVRKVRFTSHIAYAQALYADMSQNPGKNDKHRKRIRWALKVAKDINRDNDNAFMEPGLIDQVAVVKTRPGPPEMIEAFRTNYRQWRLPTVHSASSKAPRIRVPGAKP